MIRDIFNTYREAFRQWVRTKTRPKTIAEAEEKTLFWSKCYLLSVTGAIGVYLFQLLRENSNSGDRATPLAIRLARGMNENESIRVIKYSGFTRVSDETINVRDIGKDNTLKGEGTSAPEVT